MTLAVGPIRPAVKDDIRPVNGQERMAVDFDAGPTARM